MFDDKVRRFLEKPITARMATLGADGYPHVVPVWFLLDGYDLLLTSPRATRKVKDIQRNPRGAITVGGDRGDGQGYLLKGEFLIEEDPDCEFLRKITYHYEEGEEAEKDLAVWEAMDSIKLRFRVHKVISVYG